MRSSRLVRGMNREPERFAWVVGPGETGLRLDCFLAVHGRIGTRSQVRRLIDGGHVLVQGRRVKAGTRLREGDHVTAERPPPTLGRVEPEPIELEVLYEDESILVINKPPRLVVHPAPGHPGGTLVNAILYRWGRLEPGMDPLRPGIVHRLDKDTSGVLVIARTVAALEFLARQFRRREVRKEYLALTWGKIAQPRGRIEGRIGRDRVHRKRMAVQERGREAVTRFEVLEAFRENTLVRVYPETGRTHQIRVHLAEIGHPVVGDRQYGGVRRPARALIPRQALHAAAIRFRHPATSEEMVIRAPLADDFAEALTRLRNTS